MKKIKITKEQYNAILLAEQNRLINKSNDLLTESINENIERIDEGWKEVVLGISMLMGLQLTGQNNAIANKAIHDKATMSQIEATLEDGGKTQQLVDLMKEKGMQDPSDLLTKNAEKIVSRYNKIADDDDFNVKLGVVAVNNLKSLESKLKQGYALKSAEISQDTIKGKKNPTIVKIQDTLSIDMGNMQKLFDTGGYNLSEDGKQAIKDAINSVVSQNGKILKVEIESSTDAENMPSLKSNEDPTGNITLANLRSKSVNDLIGGMVGDAEITTREIPNNGSDVVSQQEFKKAATNKEALTALRQESSQFRYVKLNIVAEFTSETEDPNPAPDKIIKKLRFELVKMYETTGTIKMGGGKPKFKHKKFKCKKLKDKTGVANCFTF